MKILVPVKRVVDYEAKIKVLADGSGIETDAVKWIVNPFDEIAVEEAVRLKEAGIATEVVVVSVGVADAVTQLRYAMAMGADSAILVKHEGEIDSDLAARALAAVWQQGEYSVLLLGKLSIDSDASQTPQIIAQHLGLPHASFASKVEVSENSVTVTREVDGGLETCKLQLPCVISTDLRLNEPRYAPLPGIMKAKKKPLTELSLEDLQVEASVKVRVKSMRAPEERQAGKKVADVAELVDLLKNEAKVL